MHRTRTDEGWILRRQEYGEADLWLDVYAQALGRVRVLARGARKVRSRKGGHLQLFQQVRMTLAQGRAWWILTQAQSQRWFPELRQHLDRYAAAGYLAELVLRLVPEGERLPGLYPLLSQALEAVARHPQGHWAPRYFEWKMLALAGYRPQWDACVRCAQPMRLGRPKFFDPAAGGVLCSNCRTPRSLPLPDRAWAALRHWDRATLDAVLRHPPEEDLFPQLEALGRAYVQTWLETPPRAWKVQREV